MTRNGGMLTGYAIGVLALAPALRAAVIFGRRRQQEPGPVSACGDLNAPLRRPSIANGRHESAMPADPSARESDGGVAEPVRNRPLARPRRRKPQDLLDWWQQRGYTH